MDTMTLDRGVLSHNKNPLLREPNSFLNIDGIEIETKSNVSRTQKNHFSSKVFFE